MGVRGRLKIRSLGVKIPWAGDMPVCGFKYHKDLEITPVFSMDGMGPVTK